MFGESESESPRVGSPWDSFIADPLLTPSSLNTELELKTRKGEGVPKLVPEVEYGNVEYKLKLLNPSPERFTRLVTQMKWRLLEGGGQAYYELGVADSGQLVGLSRSELDQSLETLEMMAGEIGASVIVVKEIEVPAVLVPGINPAPGFPRHPRTPTPVIIERDVEPSSTSETEASTTEDDDDLFIGPILKTLPNDGEVRNIPVVCRHVRFTNSIRSHPERPASQSSPDIRPSLPDSSEFDMDSIFHLDYEIEIASVYKPRPHRRRASPTVHSKHIKHGPVPNQQIAHVVGCDVAVNASQMRMGRNIWRDGQNALPMAGHDVSKMAGDPRQSHVRLEIPLGSKFGVITPEPTDLNLRDEPEDEHVAEPRLIVEALVVRKLALEEAFLDFGGFALEA